MIARISKTVGLLPLALGFASALPTSQVEPWNSPLSARADKVGNGCSIRSDYSPHSELSVSFPSFDSDKADLMRYRFQSGVNLGSWFVSEKWMAPSLFHCAHDGEKGELAILRGYGNSSTGIQSARALLEKHWDTWITADDFSKMHNDYQINSVRIPIAYWNLPGAQFTKDTPFEAWSDVYKNSWKYVRRAIKMASDNNIGVLLVLHGAYGSQNGQENSGFSGFETEFFRSENQKRTKDALVWIVNDLKDVTNLVGLELLNEPKDEAGLGWWYKKTAKAIRDLGGNAANLPIYLGDPAGPDNIAESVSTHSFTAYDTHQYYTFTHRNTPEPDILKEVLGTNFDRFMNLKDSTKNRLVIGEWSCALDPGSLSGTITEKTKQRADFCQSQIESYRNSSSAMYFWSYKYEDCDLWGGWCFEKMYGRYIQNYGGYGLQSADDASLSTSLHFAPRFPKHGKSQSELQGYKDGFNVGKKLTSQHPIVPLGFKYDYMKLMFGRHNALGLNLNFDEYQTGFNHGLQQIECKVESHTTYSSDSCKNVQSK
ncbi:hypothetical protein MEQU1_003748 [Malassezia equina]|uniref:Glycoside hydrolase family 5 domain-containing protein n=1 Tax=Malassezia equina TaxID=1381935 RepID=A0AAF0EIQ4_9BASI|nr:hypothetical protein MEQU1_003748 [Malassezia equina]